MTNIEEIIKELKAEIAELKRRVIALEKRSGSAYDTPSPSPYDLDAISRFRRKTKP